MTSEAHNTPVSTPSGPAAGLEGQDATQETQDATEAAQRRVERYAEALDLHSFRLAATDWQRFVLRVIAVADQEQAELRAEVGRLRNRAEGWEAVILNDTRIIRAAEARVAELEATVARVRELAEEWEQPGGAPSIEFLVAADQLRASLDAPKDTTETPCPTCSGPSRETVGMVCQTCGTDYAPKGTTAP